jgi:hypothetical protein
VKARTPAELRRFVSLGSDVEAVLQRCGADTFDLVLIDLRGQWTRWVFSSEDAAEAVARDLGVPLHHRWDDDRMSLRMSRGDPWNTPDGKRRAL